MRWLREGFEGRRDELETRSDFERRTGISAASLTGHFKRYADKMPKVVAVNGRLKYFLAEELDTFIAWVQQNSGTRSEADVKRAEIARVRMRIEETRERIRAHRDGLRKAEVDLRRYQRDLKNHESDLRFLEQGE